MKNYLYLLIGACLFICLNACDDGRLYEEEIPISTEGRTVHMKARLTGIKTWPQSSFYVAIAGFNNDSDYALISKTVPAPSVEGGEVTISLSGIKEEVTSVELCVISRLRQRVLSYYTVSSAELATGNEINVDAGTLNVGMFPTIQERVFNTTCVNCHGAATSAAAGLYLTEGRSHAAMVGVPSKKIDGMNIVEPGKANESVLYQALATDISIEKSWRYNHTAEVVNDDMLALIRTWINQGAEE
ncbi:MAG: hypothetical protein J6T82_03500 [Bacteroidaceae bacterium]|nr:hypothetical protein [Bacteroidaceae bacterium]